MHNKLYEASDMVARKTKEGALNLVYFASRSSEVGVEGAEDHKVCVYLRLYVYAASRKYSSNLLCCIGMTVVSSTPNIHSLFLFPT